MIETDVCIIGGGPGGLACADLLALHNQRVVVVNEGSIMGYGIEGAFTSKAEFEITRQYVYASLRPEIFGNVRAPSFERVIRGARKAADGLGVSIMERLDRLGVTLIEGIGSFVDPHTIAVGEERIHARHIVIATGSRPRLLPGVQPLPGRVLTSDTVFDLEHKPESILIIGAGVIGCEFACIFAALGTRTRLLDSQDRILSMEDPDISKFVARTFESYGIEVIPSSRFSELVVDGDRVRTTLADGTVIDTDAALMAVGRVACTDQLNIEAAGLAPLDGGYIPTDNNMVTSADHIYAVGDVGRRNTPLDMALVHVAQAEGRCAGHHILNEPFESGMDHVPYIIFTIPMLAGAGLSETVARERLGNVRIGKYPYGRNHRAHAISPPIGFVKLIVGPPGDDRILGVRVVGRDADTLVAAASIMIERSLPYTYLLDCIMPHPSLMECLQGAAHIIEGDTLSYTEGEEYDFGASLRPPGGVR